MHVQSLEYGRDYTLNWILPKVENILRYTVYWRQEYTEPLLMIRTLGSFLMHIFHCQQCLIYAKSKNCALHANQKASEPSTYHITLLGSQHLTSRNKPRKSFEEGI